VLDDTISDDEMDRLFAEDHDEINALLREAYDAKDRGECARLEPLHVILAQERTRFNSSRSDPARQDISDIYQHLAREAGLEIADMVLARITEALYRAAERPLAYRRRTELQGAPRRINVFRYSIFFEELLELSGDLGSGIYILRVLHSARDIRRILLRKAADR
jgi:plasmid stabilization system protein ParE